MITIKTPEEISIMRQGGKILALALKEVEKQAKPGVTTLALDKAAEAFILSHQAKPAFKGYEGFPYSLCTSVNEDVVHGYPSQYILKNGDVLKLDLGVLYQGFNTDSAITMIVGEGDKEKERLVEVTKKSLTLGIKKARLGSNVGDIGHEVQMFVEKKGFSVVRDLVGHGIGKEVHEEPKVPNYGKKGEGAVLREGMVICIEPMVQAGSFEIETSKDGFGYKSKDNSLTAHFEHTIAITKKGPEVLTRI